MHVWYDMTYMYDVMYMCMMWYTCFGRADTFHIFIFLTVWSNICINKADTYHALHILAFILKKEICDPFSSLFHLELTKILEHT